MESRRKTGAGAARSVSPSATVHISRPPARGPTGDVADPMLAASERWLSLDREIRLLQIAWGKHESWLARERNWYRLSKSEQSAITDGRKLTSIEAQVDELEEEGGNLLDTLASTPAGSAAGVVGKLQVASTLLQIEDNPVVHRLIVRAISDLKVLAPP